MVGVRCIGDRALPWRPTLPHGVGRALARYWIPCNVWKDGTCGTKRSHVFLQVPHLYKFNHDDMKLVRKCLPWFKPCKSVRDEFSEHARRPKQEICKGFQRGPHWQPSTRDSQEPPDADQAYNKAYPVRQRVVTEKTNNDSHTWTTE